MKKEEKTTPELVIMAAGMSTRYGKLKQVDPMDEQGHTIMDFSIYDAVRSGFSAVTFVVKKENMEIIKSVVGDRIAKYVEVKYAIQDTYDIPEGEVVPEGRVKPWGTAHAIYSCRNIVKNPFAVINADDLYGRTSFALAYDFLKDIPSNSTNWGLIGYKAVNTLAKNGTVSRAECRIDEKGYLSDIEERSNLYKKGDVLTYTLNGGEATMPIDGIVSMNFWCFTPEIFNELGNQYQNFFDTKVKKDPLKAEFFIPTVIDNAIKGERAKVKVELSLENWYGVTHPEDKADIVAHFESMFEKGDYPRDFFA